LLPDFFQILELIFQGYCKTPEILIRRTPLSMSGPPMVMLLLFFNITWV